MSMYGSNCLRTLFVAMVALTTACATLPEMPPHRPEAALNDVESSPLAALATASVPKNRPSWSGFRLFYSGESAFNARIALVRRASAVMTDPPCQRPISNTESRSMIAARILRGS